MASTGKIQAWIARHPILAVVITIGVFLVWQLPAWFGDVWPLFTNKTLPEWLAEHQEWTAVSNIMEFLSTVVSLLYVPVVTIAMLSFLVFIVRQQRNLGEGGHEQSSSPPTSLISPSQLQANEIIYPSPSKNGVLWRWVDGAGMSGPYCPIHRTRLYYWPNFGSSRAEFKEDDWLSGNASFVCPHDEKEEFIFIRPSALKVGQLRAQAADRFQSEVERAQIEDARIQANLAPK